MKTKRLSIFIAAAVMLMVISCPTPLLESPRFPSGSSSEINLLPPASVSATHGERRSINVSWDAVPNAEKYFLYRADSPLAAFVKCGETSDTQLSFNVPAGGTVYYRVSSVSRDGRESQQSFFVKGTSLAQPVINNIDETTESTSVITWYMENASEDTYLGDLLYAVYCFNGSVEFAQIIVEASGITEKRVTFSGLNANTQYTYQVEAYLRGDQGSGERSDRVDAATARRLRPGAPANLRAARGNHTSQIELSFELPEMVDISVGENIFNQHPLYFTISRRIYSESAANTYQIISSYFGTNPVTAASRDGQTFNEYTSGAIVSWTDKNVIRGEMYEYLIQAYVDDTPRLISSDDSTASSAGWTLSEGNLSFGNINYILHEVDDLFVAATLQLHFELETRGETYEYKLVERIEPIRDDDPLDPEDIIERSFSGSDFILTRIMNLTSQTTNFHSGRGLYSYAIEIKQNDITLDTITTIGQVEVSENTQPIIVENFSIQDGYTDRYVLKWTNYSNRRYEIFSTNDRSSWDFSSPVAIINPVPSDDDSVENDFSYTISGQVPGTSMYFAIRPSRVFSDSTRNGQTVYANAVSRTLGIPEASLGGSSTYSLITAAWTEAQRADFYRIRYRYDDQGDYTTAATINRTDLSISGDGRLTYSFVPNGSDDVSRAGKTIHIEIDALNESLRIETGSIDEISTTSANTVTTSLVGPALLNLEASKAASATGINVSWDRVSGAAGYYVFRRQFNINNTAEQGAETVVYYIPDSSSPNVTGKNMALDTSNSRVDTTTVKATASLNGTRFTLNDMYLTDNEYDGNSTDDYNNHTPTYRNQQNDMIQGLPYRYFIVPVITRGGSPESLSSITFDYETDGTGKNTYITSYSIQGSGEDITYSGAAAIEQAGFTVGFGQNVTATKGSYASSGNTNNGIQISWTAPSLLAGIEGFTPRYTLYRRVTGGLWGTVSSNLDVLNYVDNPDRGIAYEYAVGISNGSGAVTPPGYSRRYIELSQSLRDERNRPYMLGFMLDMVRMNSVSRDERTDEIGNFGELVQWYSAGITGNHSQDHSWGIEGYEVFVMNRNIDANWHTIADITSIPDQTNLAALVTNSGGLLKVWRDYKHFFKVRSYVLNNDGIKIYSPDPIWTYQYRFGTNEAAHIAASELMQNDYVKWGARQITAREFAQIASMYIARGVERRRGGTWTSTLFWGSANASTSWGGSGYVRDQSNAGVTTRNWEYRDYKDDLQTRTGDWMTFLTVDGNMWMATRASGWPQTYGRATNNYRDNRLWITGPWDTPGLYSGAIHYGGGGTADVTRTGGNGNIHVIYPSGTSQQTVIVHGENDTPLAFDYGLGNSQNRHRLNDDTWR